MYNQDQKFRRCLDLKVLIISFTATMLLLAGCSEAPEKSSFLQNNNQPQALENLSCSTLKRREHLASQFLLEKITAFRSDAIINGSTNSTLSLGLMFKPNFRNGLGYSKRNADVFQYTTWLEKIHNTMDTAGCNNLNYNNSKSIYSASTLR